MRRFRWGWISTYKLLKLLTACVLLLLSKTNHVWYNITSQAANHRIRPWDLSSKAYGWVAISSVSSKWWPVCPIFVTPWFAYEYQSWCQQSTGSGALARCRRMNMSPAGTCISISYMTSVLVALYQNSPFGLQLYFSRSGEIASLGSDCRLIQSLRSPGRGTGAGVLFPIFRESSQLRIEQMSHCGQFFPAELQESPGECWGGSPILLSADLGPRWAVSILRMVLYQ